MTTQLMVVLLLSTLGVVLARVGKASVLKAD
jgi:hypothetical protein